jgi:monoamine oxidase
MTAWPVRPQEATDELRGIRVLVGGAGLAGLSAARDLESRGAHATVVDARERVGGRVWTLRDGFADAQHVEAGGDLIDSDQKSVVALARELDLPLVRILKKGFGYCGTDRAGRVCIQSVEEGFESAWGLLQELIDQYKLSEQRWDGAIAQAMARRSVADWLRGIDADEWLTSRFRGLRGLFLADSEDLSLLAMVDFFATGSFGDAHMLRVEGGNDRLATETAKRLRQPVHFRSVLRRVTSTPGGVVAHVEDAAGVHEIGADYLVCAIPAATARDVEWGSALPDMQRTAYARLRAGRAEAMRISTRRTIRGGATCLPSRPDGLCLPASTPAFAGRGI